MPAPSIAERNRRSETAKAARREEILGAARRVFAARGFRGTTIADIAEDADVALGTIYLYFASKEDVFAALNQRFNELIIAALTNVPPAVSLDETVRLRINNVFAACAENRDLVRLVVLNSDPESEVTKRMRQSHERRNGPMVRVLTEAMRAGQIRVADPCIMTNLTYGLVSIAVYQAFVLSNGDDADKYRDGCVDMVVSYMSPVTEVSAARATKVG